MPSTALRVAGSKGEPPRITWLKCPPPRTDYLTHEECDRLLGHADGIVHEMILTALRTGMRQGELKGLQWSSIDWQTRVVTVRHSKSDYSDVLGSPKSNRERHIPMHDDLVEVLSRRRQTDGYVFVDESGRPFDHAEAQAAHGERLQEGRPAPHWMAHAAAHLRVTLGNAWSSARSVQALLGHSNITTTMRYAHLAPSTLRTAIDLLVPQMLSGQPAGNQWIEAQQSVAGHIKREAVAGIANVGQTFSASRKARPYTTL